jgi:Domain of unknown function (DUF927)
MENVVLEHARRFLERVLPPLTEDKTAYLNIHWSSPAKNEDGTPRVRENGEKIRWWDGRACESVDEAIKTIAWVNGQGDKDIYVCMSLQAKYEQKTSARGNTYKKALRLADDVVAIRSLYIDVDVKETAYPDTKAALRAFKDFIGTVGLPMPSACVASGSGGFHAHWALDQSLEAAEWQVLANALSAAIRETGLIADTQCTVDSARILRIPQTFNRKSDVPSEVTLLSLGGEVSVDDIRSALSKWLVAGPANQGLFQVKVGAKIAANDDLGANLTSGKSEINVDAVAKQCAFIARQLGTGGKDTSQPLWFLAASVSCFLEDGKDVFHDMSNQHAGYTRSATDEMYERAANKQKTRDLGWTTCEAIAAAGCKDCETCPLFASKKSPLHFATAAVAATSIAVDDTLPEKYSRAADGTVIMKHVDENGTLTTVPLCHYPILQGWLSNNPWTFHFVTKTETGKKTTVEIPTEVIFSKEGVNKFLGSKGFFLADKQYKALKEFFVSWLQKLQTQKESVISAAPFGWSVVDGKVEGFTYAGRVWTPDGDRPAANPNPVLQYQYSPKGDITPWRETAKIIYEQQRPGLDAILAVAFAGPLVKFTGFGGLILNAYSSESGIGKTTAMKVSQSVWASPVLAMQGLDDTANSVLNKMGQLRSLPMYWDEIKSEEQIKRFCSVVFNLTGGREKTRLNSDSTLKTSGTWQTMMVSASNDTLTDGMSRAVGSTTAGLHRLFEYVVAKPQQVTSDVGSVQRLLGKLDENYGHAGLIYARFLGEHHKRVEIEVAKMQDELYTETNVKQEERMWIATMAVVLKGAMYANELGLTDISIPVLKDFMLDVLAKMRAEVDKSPSDLNNDMTVSTILAEFLNNTRSRNTLMTSRIHVGRGKPAKGAIQILNDVTKLGEIAVQIGRDDRMIRISSVFLTRWMGERNYSRHTFVKKLEAEFGVKIVNGKLGSGTEMACAMEYLVEFDMNNPKLASFLE